MLTITPVATGKIREIMTEQHEESSTLRIVVTGMGCSGPQYMMALEQETKPDDIFLDSGGLKIVVDPDTAQLLDGSEIDYIESLEKSGFTINNPNIQPSGGGCCSSGGAGGCSCGQ